MEILRRVTPAALSHLVWLPAIWASFIIRPAAADFVSTDYDAYNNGELGHQPHLEFHSSDEYAPMLQATIWNREAISDTGSHIFLKHDGNASSPISSPLILNANDLSAIYINRTFQNVFDTRIQENFGKKYLTFWAGYRHHGIGDGWGLVYDDAYRLAYKVSAQNIAAHSDFHEFTLTGNGTALVIGIEPMENLTQKWDIPHSFDIKSAIFQEVDLETNKVLFDWRALDHINPSDSFESIQKGWDAYHINSIEKTQAGNYLISLRHMHSIYLIDGQTGDIIWTLGGKGNDFTELSPPVQPLLTMAWQHHARYVPGTNETQMTLFDNHVTLTTHGECDDTECSRGLHIAINDTISPPEARILREFHHPIRLQAGSQGSMQALGTVPVHGDVGSVFIGWGRCPSFTEHNWTTGKTVMDVQFSPWHSQGIPDALDNYRVYRMDWSATPWWDPAIAPKQNAQGELVIYVSWNGATDVASWVVRGSASADHEGVVLSKSRRTGFETKLTVGKTEWQYVWVDAVDALGRILRSTETVDLDNTALSVAADAYEKANSTFRPIVRGPQPEHAGLATTLMTLIGTGLSVFIMAIIATGVIFWYRYSGHGSVHVEGFAMASDNESDDEGDDTDGSDNEDADPQSKPDGDSTNRALLSKAKGRHR